jgi:hypothetical protein
MKELNGFLILLLGGVVFVVLMFAFMGIGFGYTLTLAAICAAGGLLFTISISIIGVIIVHFAPTDYSVSLKDKWLYKRNRKKLDVFEAQVDDQIEARFSAKTYPPKGMKKLYCAASVCFFQDKMCVSFVYARKICHQYILYSAVRAAYITGVWFAEIVLYGNNRLEIWLDNEEDSQAFHEMLVKKGLLKELDEKYKDVPFLTVEESVGAPCFELQFCKSEPDLDREWARDDFCKSDSLYIYHEGNWFDENGSAFRSLCCLFNYMSTSAGDNGIDADGPSYFDRDKTKYILEKVKEAEKAVDTGDFQRIIPWLTKAANEYNGFYFLGI